MRSGIPWLVWIFLASSCGHRLFTAPDPATPNQVWITERTHTYAAVLQVTIHEVRFKDDPPITASGAPAAGWVECPKLRDKNTVWYNAVYLEEAVVGSGSYMEAVSAHEACHIYYRDNEYPCRADEYRATLCAEQVLRGKKP